MAFNPNQQQPPLNWSNYQENMSYQNQSGNQHNWFDNVSNLQNDQQVNNMPPHQAGQFIYNNPPQAINRTNLQSEALQTFTMQPLVPTLIPNTSNNNNETKTDDWSKWDDEWQESNKNASHLHQTINNQLSQKVQQHQYNQNLYAQTSVPAFNTYSTAQQRNVPTSDSQTLQTNLIPVNNLALTGHLNAQSNNTVSSATDYFNQNIIGTSNTNVNQWNTLENNNFQFGNFNPNSTVLRDEALKSNIEELGQRQPDNSCNFSQPDIKNNTLNQQLARVIKSEVLSPQWSTESQFSQTSSERSSENVDSSSSNAMVQLETEQTLFYNEFKTETPNLFIENKTENEEIIAESQVRSMSIDNCDTKDEDNSFLPLPPPPVIQTEQPEIISKRQTPPLPPPPFENQATVSNPYKRVGGTALGHHQKSSSIHLLSTANEHNVAFSVPTSNLLPISSVTFDQNTNVPLSYSNSNNQQADKILSNEHLEKTPNNDRNEYLQIGHLSEDGYNVETQDTQSDQNDNLPPPGFSRLVLGQQEQENRQQQPEQRIPEENLFLSEPPPGLDRMIPGTDLEIENDLILERQADGEVSDDQSNVRSNFLSPQPTVDQNFNDRNLYLVPGESNISSQHRFIPGVENDNQDVGVVSMSDQQRELVMDGENLQDNPPPNKESNRTLEGGNTIEDSIVIHQTETDSVLTVENARKDISNTSTCEDSDKDRYGYHKNRPRRDNDFNSKRVEKNRSRDKYDSEDSDYSDREKRQRERDYKYNDGERRRDPEKPRRKEFSGKDNYYGGEKERNRYEREKERYSRSKHDRYETDDSKYETERSSRYHSDRKYRDRDDYYKKGDDRIERRYHRERDDRRKDDRTRDDRKRNPDYDGYEYRTGSRNDRVRERYKGERGRDDRERKISGRPDLYGSYNYDPYMYYMQHQGYFEQLRRTNPQAYADWYRSYVIHMQRNPLTTDGRESVHSGRSSANDNDRYNRPIQHFYSHEEAQRQLSQSQPSAMLDQSFLSETSSQVHSLYQPSMRRTPNLQNFGDRSYQSEIGYYQQRTNNIESTATGIETKHRTTPCKFAISHPVSSLSCGILVTVKSKYSNNGYPDAVKILNIGINDSIRKLFHSFPGPLVKSVTHKKTIIEFCEEQLKIGPLTSQNLYGQAKSRGNSVTSLNSADHHSRGSFTLLWNYLILLLRQNGTFDGTAISELLMKNKEEFPLESTNTSIKSGKQSGRTSVISNVEREDISYHSDHEEQVVEKQEYSEFEITDKFRNYLIYGDINGALAFASEHNLWGHAFFLASKVDRRQHAEIMLKFANKIKLNDPLQTLYQLMSGRIPSSVSNVADEKWGDWRPHLAMLMSNSSEKPELIKKSITTLGDSLHNRGDLYGSQFCYLLSDVTFSRYTNVKQDSPFITASPHCARMILLGSNPQKNFKEFATNEAIMMTEIYEYARSLSESRYTIVELQYYKYLLATRMLDYGMQLKCLIYMEQIAERIIEEPNKYDRDFIEKIFTLGDRLKYVDPVMEKALDESIDNMGRNNNYSNVEDQKWLQNLSNILKCEPITNTNEGYNQENVGNYLNSNDGYGLNVHNINEEIKSITDGIKNLISKDNSEIFDNSQMVQPEESLEISTELNTMNQHYDDNYSSYNPQNNNQQLYVSSYPDNYIEQGSNLQASEEINHVEAVQHSYNTDWNYNNEIPKPTISMPHASSKSNENTFSGQNQSDTQKSTPSIVQHGDNKQQTNKSDNKQQSQSSNWFGGIWNKLAKKNNQMILPDDKNPSIVWDDQKKRWVNKDGDENETTEYLKPPPKMSELPNNIQPVLRNVEPAHPSSSIITDVANNNIQRTSNPLQPNMVSHQVNKPSDNVPTLQTNAYHRKRNQALKKSYVDVFNPSGAPTRNTDSIMAPPIPDMSIPQAGFFIPGPSTQTNEQQFYDPTQY